MKKLLLFIFLPFFIVACSSTNNQKEEPSHNAYVILSFDIDENGHTKNIEVVEANPKEVFDKEAIRVLSKWKYKPKIVDGKAVVQKNLNVQIDFKLAQQLG